MLDLDTLIQSSLADDSLKHYGVKGMKWGKRKVQESANTQRARENVASKKEAVSKTRFSTDRKAAKNAAIDYKYAKKDLSNSKILDKLNSSEKSKQQIDLEKKYRKKGLNEDDAAVAAYKNIRTKKIIKTAAAVAVTAAVAYAGYKAGDHFLDKVIKSGETLQNVAKESDEGIRDAFYSARNKFDKVKYRGIYGNQLADRYGEAFAKEIKVMSPIKQASPHNARKILNDMVAKDPEFRETLINTLSYKNNLGDVYNNHVDNARKALKSGKANKSVYEALNIRMVDHSPEFTEVKNKYFKGLMDKGYNAIKDVNDSKYSGFNTLNPVIAFGTQGKVKVETVKQLTPKQLKRENLLAWSPEFVKLGAMFGLAAGAQTAANKATSKAVMDTQVKAYQKKNPGTKLSYNEIAAQIEKQRG